MTIEDDNRFYIDKEVFQKFQQQNPTGYFHLLYLVTETNNIALNKSIRDYQSKITDQGEEHIQEINEARAKQREIIKTARTRYGKMLESTQAEIRELKEEIENETK